MDVFVYGTLKQGQCRNHVLTNYGGTLLGKAEVQGVLYDLGAYPAAVLTNANKTFLGEVWSIPDDQSEECLQVLDRIEGHPDYYQRARITVGDRRNVVAYFMPSEMIGDRPTISQWPEVQNAGENEQQVAERALPGPPAQRNP